MTPRETYVENVKLALDELNDELRAFETRVTHTRQDERERYALELAKLRAHARVATTKWQALAASSERTWHQLVPDVEHARNAFSDAFHEFRTHLGR